jgi:hypothetical protein
MNICLVTPIYKIGKSIDSGLGNHFFDLAHELSDLGHDVHVLYVANEDLIEEFSIYKQSTINIHFLKTIVPQWLSSFFQDKWAQYLCICKLFAVIQTQSALKLLVEQYSIDIVETTSFEYLCLAYLYCKKRPPVVTRVSITMEQIYNENYQLESRALKVLSWFERFAIQHSDHLLTHTVFHRDEVSNSLGINPARFKVIPHGVCLPELPYILERKEFPQKIKILYVGRFEYRKGIDVLIKAIPKVLNQNENIFFNLVGEDIDSRFKREFEQNTELLFRSRVTFTGKVDQDVLHCLYQECDIFVAPSRYESFGLTYAEAMSYGKPAIGCWAGGIPEVIDEGVTGLLAIPGDAEDLADKIIKLANDPSLCSKMAKKARRRVEELFTKEQMAFRTLSNYEEILR